MRHVILGAGEVGSAIDRVLRYIDGTCKLNGLCQLEDSAKGMTASGNFRCMHVCFPYSGRFVESVLTYTERFSPRLIVVHSTVKPGTTEKIIHDHVVYSPVRGRHADLWKHILQSVKYYCGTTLEAEAEFERIFADDLEVKRFHDIRSLEFAKIASTTYYGWCLVFMRAVREECSRKGYNFDEVYREWNRTYNEMVEEDFQRPIYEYVQGPIGGHCVMQNLDLLGDDLCWMKDLLEGRA